MLSGLDSAKKNARHPASDIIGGPELVIGSGGLAEIVICEFMDDASVAALSAEFDTLYDPGLVDRPEDLMESVAAASALVVRNRTQVRGKLLAACRSLKVIGRLGVGLDNIDLEACRARGIQVCPATGANDQSVAEYVVASVMMLIRQSYHSSAAVQAGTWPRDALIGCEVAGKRLGLIGFGSIAREVARRATALGMQIAAYDPYVPADEPAWRLAAPMDLDALLASSDAVSLHLPLTAETRHFMDVDRIAAMKPGAVLINSARGGVLNEEALVEALRGGHLAGAALDVFEDEPLGSEAGAKFTGLNNLLLTPHIAGVTQESNIRVGAVTVENLRRVLRQSD